MDTESRSGSPVEAVGDEYTISLQGLFRVIWQRLWLIMLVAFVFSGMVVGLSLMQTPIYEAYTKILVGQEQPVEVPGNLASDVQGLQQLTVTVVEAVNSRSVAEAVIQELDLRITPEAFLQNLSVGQVKQGGGSETQFIQISYKDPDPEQAEAIANTVGVVSSDRISEVSPNASRITTTVWEFAAEPGAPISPNPIRNGALALALGIMMGVGLAFLMEYLDNSWRSPEELEQISGLPIFAVIPTFRVSRKIRKARKQQEASKNERGYRVIRKNERRL